MKNRREFLRLARGTGIVLATSPLLVGKDRDVNICAPGLDINCNGGQTPWNPSAINVAFMNSCASALATGFNKFRAGDKSQLPGISGNVTAALLHVNSHGSDTLGSQVLPSNYYGTPPSGWVNTVYGSALSFGVNMTLNEMGQSASLQNPSGRQWVNDNFISQSSYQATQLHRAYANTAQGIAPPSTWGERLCAIADWGGEYLWIVGLPIDEAGVGEILSLIGGIMWFIAKFSNC